MQEGRVRTHHPLRLLNRKSRPLYRRRGKRAGNYQTSKEVKEQVKKRLLLVLLVTLSFCWLTIPKATASNVTILSSSSFVDTICYHHIFGEVQNNGAQPLEFVKVIATYYNNVGTVIATESGYTLVDLVLPGTRSPFQILLSQQFAPQVDHYSLEVTYRISSKQKPPGIQILSDSNYMDILGSLHIVGEAKNEQAQNATFINVIVTLYNQTGVVIGCDDSYTDPYDLDPNQTAPFHIIFIYDEVIPNVTRYELTAQSQEYSVIPENMNLATMILATTSLLVLATLRIKRKTL